MINEATNMLQLYNANFLNPWFSINLKLRSRSFRLRQVFQTLMVKMHFSQIQQAPGPDFRKVGKSLHQVLFWFMAVTKFENKIYKILVALLRLRPDEQFIFTWNIKPYLYFKKLFFSIMMSAATSRYI